MQTVLDIIVCFARNVNKKDGNYWEDIS